MKLGYGGHSLLMNVFDQEDGSFGSAPGFKTGANTAHRLQGVLANYQFDRTFKNKLSFRTRSFYDFAHREFQRDAINNVYSPILAYRTGAAARMNYEFTGSLNLEVGGDWEYRHANEASSRNRTTGALVDGFVDKAVNEGSTFVQLDWSPGAWRFIGGTRFSRNSTFGSNVSSRGTVGYSINDNNAVKFVAGQSYRSPSIFEIFTATPNISGNPALKPETSDSFDLVYQYNKGGFYVQADGYFAQYKEKIYRKKGTPPAGAPQPKAPAFYENGSPVHAFGLEVEAKYVSPKWGTYFVNVDSLDGSHGDLVVEQPGSYQNYNFRYVPTYNVSFGLAKQFRHVGMSALVDNSGATNGPFGKVNGWTDLQLNIYFEHPLKDLTIRHTFSGRNVLASNVAFPEFSRRKANVNELPMGADSGFFYTLSFRFFEK
jgi:outer membrane cobalamin receptor